MKVTVILCIYNRCRLLAAALDSVALSALPGSVDWEVLVVDNNSSDLTREVVDEVCRRRPGRFRYQLEPRQGKSHALNSGIAGASGDVPAFMDDDVEVEPNWLENLTAPLRDGGFADSGGRVVPNWPNSLPSWLVPEGWSALGPLAAFDQVATGMHSPSLQWARIWLFKKTMFEKYGNFRADLGPCPGGEIRNEETRHNTGDRDV